MEEYQLVRTTTNKNMAEKNPKIAAEIEEMQFANKLRCDLL